MLAPSSTPPEAPLDSWKAIAAYLDRDVRTVRRWEASEGLPVHRRRHLTRSSVYAYPSELDLWRASRRETRVASAPFAARGRVRMAAVAALGALTLVAGAFLWFNGEAFDLRVAPFGGLPAGSTGRVLLHDKELPYVQPFDCTRVPRILL